MCWSVLVAVDNEERGSATKRGRHQRVAPVDRTKGRIRVWHHRSNRHNVWVAHYQPGEWELALKFTDSEVRTYLFLVDSNVLGRFTRIAVNFFVYFMRKYIEGRSRTGCVRTSGYRKGARPSIWPLLELNDTPNYANVHTGSAERYSRFSSRNVSAFAAATS